MVSKVTDKVEHVGNIEKISIFAKKDSHIKLSNKHTCPFAILAAAVIYYSTEKNCRIHETEFDIHGTELLLNRSKEHEFTGNINTQKPGHCP